MTNNERLKFSELADTISKLGQDITELSDYGEENLVGGETFALAFSYLYKLFKEEAETKQILKEHGAITTKCARELLIREGYTANDFSIIWDYLANLSNYTVYADMDFSEGDYQSKTRDLIDLLVAIDTRFKTSLWAGLFLIIFLSEGV